MTKDKVVHLFMSFSKHKNIIRREKKKVSKESTQSVQYQLIEKGKDNNLTMFTITLVSLMIGVDATLSSTLHVCNRGFCYNKKESWTRNTPSLTQKRTARLNSCKEPECDLYEILGSEFLEEEEAIECPNCPPPATEDQTTINNAAAYDDFFQCEILEGIDFDERRSWKEEPKKGSCYDKDLGHVFDCNLLQILDDGNVLIEDVKSGGDAFATAPSVFHLRNKDEKKREHTNLPNVVVTGEDPNEDFRTNVEINMLGL